MQRFGVTGCIQTSRAGVGFAVIEEKMHSSKTKWTGSKEASILMLFVTVPHTSVKDNGLSEVSDLLCAHSVLNLIGDVNLRTETKMLNALWAGSLATASSVPFRRGKAKGRRGK